MKFDRALKYLLAGEKITHLSYEATFGEYVYYQLVNNSGEKELIMMQGMKKKIGWDKKIDATLLLDDQWIISQAINMWDKVWEIIDDTRVVRVLMKHNINTIEQLHHTYEKDLSNIKGLGLKSLNLIKKRLNEFRKDNQI